MKKVYLTNGEKFFFKVAGFVITSELVLHLALLVFCMRQILHRINYHNFSSVTLNY